jgi:hypothetical protein
MALILNELEAFFAVDASCSREDVIRWPSRLAGPGHLHASPTNQPSAASMLADHRAPRVRGNLHLESSRNLGAAQEARGGTLDLVRSWVVGENGNVGG